MRSVVIERVIERLAGELGSILPYKLRVRRPAIIDFETPWSSDDSIYAEAFTTFLERAGVHASIAKPVEYLEGLAFEAEYLTSAYALHAAAYHRLTSPDDDEIVVTYGLYKPPIEPSDAAEIDALLSMVHSVAPPPHLVILVDVPCHLREREALYVKLCESERNALIRVLEHVNRVEEPGETPAARLYNVEYDGRVAVKRVEVYDVEPSVKPLEAATRELIRTGFLVVVEG